MMLGGCSNSSSPASDAAAIRDALEQWPRDFSAKNTDAVCGLFAPNTIVIYPGTPDRTYDDMCTQFRTIFSGEKQFTYSPPEIAEIVVDSDVAAVRLIWRLEVRDAAGAVLERTAENGVDVFERQPDGSWKIRISHAFPVPD